MYATNSCDKSLNPSTASMADDIAQQFPVPTGRDRYSKEFKPDILAELEREGVPQSLTVAYYQNILKKRWDALTDEERQDWYEKAKEDWAEQQTYDNPQLFA